MDCGTGWRKGGGIGRLAVLVAVLLTCAEARAVDTQVLAAPPEGVTVDVLDEQDRSQVRVSRDGEEVYTIRLQRVEPSQDTSPRCTGAGVELELVGRRDPVTPAEDAWLDDVCAALAVAQGDVLAPGEPLIDRWVTYARSPWYIGPPKALERTGIRSLFPIWPWLPLHLVVLAWWCTLLTALPRQRLVWAAAGAAVIARALAPTSLLMGGAYPYSRMMHATGLWTPNPMYGGTLDAFMGPLWWLSGGAPGILFAANAVLSVLTVLMLGSSLERAGEHEAAVGASWSLALLPLAILLSRTESMFVLVAALQACMVAGLLGERRGSQAFGVFSALLLAWLRPYQLPLVAAVACVLLWRRRWLLGGLVGGVLLARGAEVVWLLLTADVTTATGSGILYRMLDPSVVLGSDGTLILSDPWRVPAALGLFALVGLLRVRTLSTRMLLGGLVLAAVPYLHFHRITDLTRFGLPSLTWLAALAGVGLASLPRRALPGAAVIWGLTVWWARDPLPPRPWAEEHDAMLEAMEQLGPDDVVWYDAYHDASAFFSLWSNLAGPTRFYALDRTRITRALAERAPPGDPQPGHLLWRGRSLSYEGADDHGCVVVETLGSWRLSTHGLDVEPDLDAGTRATLVRCGAWGGSR